MNHETPPTWDIRFLHRLSLLLHFPEASKILMFREPSTPCCPCTHLCAYFRERGRTDSRRNNNIHVPTCAAFQGFRIIFMNS